MKVATIILAAGEGARMQSSKPKVLHPILGKPMICYAVEAVANISTQKPIVIIQPDSQDFYDVLGDGVQYIEQGQPLRTGHATLQAGALLRGQTDLVLVLSADMPLVRSETLQSLVNAQAGHPGPVTMLTVELDESHGFGRILRDASGNVQAIIEQADATDAQMAIRELNTSIYCFRSDWLWDALPKIERSAKGEYYLTDLIKIAVEDGKPVNSIKLDDPGEMIGVNNRVHLAEVIAIRQARINREWMLAGVTIIDPATTFIEPDVKIGRDTVIWPNTYLQGATQIGEGCELGPNTIIRDTTIGNHCQVLSSVLERARLEDDVDIGPFGHLRKGAHLGQGVHMGNFGEVKNSYLGPGTKMGHFSYLGDATLGPNVNIGAGTITCNYDGKNKSRTEIGADVFIGSDTMLVAPLSLGDRSSTGAGSVVTKNVAEDTLVVGIPARPIRKFKKE